MSLLHMGRRALVLLGSLLYREGRDDYIHRIEAKVDRAERIATGDPLEERMASNPIERAVRGQRPERRPE